MKNIYSKRWIRRRPVMRNNTAAPAKQHPVRSFIWRGFRGFCFLLGLGVVLTSLLGLFSLVPWGEKSAAITLPSRMVLYVTFEDGFADQPAAPGLSSLLEDAKPTLESQIEAIDQATRDPRVKGMVAVMKDGDFEVAHVQEIRKSLKNFRAAGKFTDIYASSYGEGGGGLGRFYLASAFEKRWMQPLGIVSIPGIRMEMPFFRDTLDKIGIEPQFFHRKAYKTIFENATNDHMSPQNREMLTQIVGDISGAITADMSTDLKMTPEQFTAAIDKGLFTAAEALQAGLITDANYEDVLYEKISTDITGDPKSDEAFYVDLADYGAAAGHEKFHPGNNYLFSKTKQGVALVYASGLITEADSGAAGHELGGGNGIVADDLAPVIEGLADEDWAKALVLRIDSPGGSPGASETILRAIARVREKGKPVIVSMGPVAASGGYWIASSADRIFALPSTLTGSIGVAGGKISAEKLWKDWGIHWDSVQWGRNAGLWSINTPFSASERERIDAMMDQVYNAFTARVAEGRKMTPAQVENVAQGRVWTGTAAKANGLVDEIGGLDDALDYAARQLGAEDRAGVNVQVVPEPKTALEELMDMVRAGAASTALAPQLDAAILNHIRPIADMASVFINGPVAVYEPSRLQ